MGFDLRGRGGYLGLRSEDWYQCLDVACAFGWEPAGTQLLNGPPEARGNPGPDWKWEGGYNSNDFQIVTDDDAKALAAALDRAFEAEKVGAMTKEQRAAFDGPKKTRLGRREVRAILLEEAEGRRPSWRERLKVFADFARQGSFRPG